MAGAPAYAWTRVLTRELHKRRRPQWPPDVRCLLGARWQLIQESVHFSNSCCPFSCPFWRFPENRDPGQKPVASASPGRRLRMLGRDLQRCSLHSALPTPLPGNFRPLQRGVEGRGVHTRSQSLCSRPAPSLASVPVSPEPCSSCADGREPADLLDALHQGPGSVAEVRERRPPLGGQTPTFLPCLHRVSLSRVRVQISSPCAPPALLDSAHSLTSFELHHLFQDPGFKHAHILRPQGLGLQCTHVEGAGTQFGP